MLTKAQIQAIDRIVWEYKNNPANKEALLYVQVEEREKSDNSVVDLLVELNRPGKFIHHHEVYGISSAGSIQCIVSPTNTAATNKVS